MAATCILCVAVITGPIALGGTSPWGRFSIEAAIAAAAVLWACSGPYNRSLVVPLVVAAVVLVQIVPLPDPVLMAIAPPSAGAWKAATAGAHASWGTISVDPGTTLVAARRLLLGLACAAAVADLVRSPRYRGMLVSSMAACCVAVIALALAFPPGGEDRIILGSIDLAGPIMFWKSPVHAPVQTAGCCETEWITIGRLRFLYDSWIVGDRIGPYIVSNHYAGCLAMLLPITIAAWFTLARGHVWRWLAVAVGILAGLGGLATIVFIAKSRAGTAATILSLLALTALMAQSRRVRWLSGLGAITCAATLLLTVMVMAVRPPDVERLFPEAIRPHFASVLHDARGFATYLAWRLFRAAPCLGIGLGCYWQLGSRLTNGELTLFYAHNDYAQCLAETGMAGALGLGLLTWFAVRQLRGLLRETTAPERVLASGAWAAIAGIAAHSAFDWNLHVPANALIASVAAGMALGSGYKASAASSRSRGPLAWSALSPACFAVVIVLATVFLARDAYSETVQRRVRDAIAASRIAGTEQQRQSAHTQLSQSITDAERMMPYDRLNAQLPLLVGQATLLLSATDGHSDTRVAVPDVAERWFRQARSKCGACRGLPELAPPERPKQQP